MKKDIKKALEGIECCKHRRCDKCPFIEESPCWASMLQAVEDILIDLREGIQCR